MQDKFLKKTKAKNMLQQQKLIIQTSNKITMHIRVMALGNNKYKRE